MRAENAPVIGVDGLLAVVEVVRRLRAAQAGAEWAFSLLYRDLNPRLVRYFSARVPSVAEDLCADTWLAAAGQLRSFRGGELAFRAWLFTIGRRQMIQHWRYAGRRPADPVAPEMLVDEADRSDPEHQRGKPSATLLAGSPRIEPRRALPHHPGNLRECLFRDGQGLGQDRDLP